MEQDETKKTTVEETPSERKTTEESHRPGRAGQDETTTTHRPGRPARDEKKVKVEKK